MTETTSVCKCGNSKFYVIEGYDFYSYVYLKCTECKETGGISVSNHGDITTDLEQEEGDEKA